MIPIGDDNSGRVITPFVNYALIGLNIFIYFYYQFGAGGDMFTLSFATVPQEILTGQDIANGLLQPTPIPVYGTLFTAMFMHGGLMHLGGNMLYLYVFGDNLENRLGHIKYLLFYLLCGIIASLAHVFVSSMVGKDLLIPSLGASGAISGVLGGYLLLYPRSQVRVFAFMTVIRLPAFISLGIWILLQLWDGYNSLSVAEGGGVAYAAHIGGFVAGLVLIKMFGGKEPVPITNRARFR